MAESNLSHPTYTIVKDKKDADAIAWAFVDKEEMKALPFKFPELNSKEIRAKITYTGLCHSDAHTVRQEWGPCKYPIAPGHEIVGEVTHVGKDVKDFKVGDVVGFGPQRYCCDECEFCKAGCEPLCTGGDGNNFTYGPIYWGGYASYIQQPGAHFFKVPKSLPIERVPPLFCAGITTYRPVAVYAKPGDKVAVLGIGGLGHLAVQYAKKWGCHVTAFTNSKDKEKFIKELGADEVLIADDETMKKQGSKYHLVLNTLPVGEKMPDYIALTRPLGTYVQIGLPDVSKPCPFNAAHVLLNQINVTGSLIGSRKEMNDMLEFSAKHNIAPLCEQFSFDDFPKAYDRLVNGRPIFRCVVDCTKAHN